MNPLWLLRLVRLLRHPPSKSRVVLILVVLGIVAALYGIEHIWGWPDWLQVNRVPRGRHLRY